MLDRRVEEKFIIVPKETTGEEEAAPAQPRIVFQPKAAVVEEVNATPQAKELADAEGINLLAVRGTGEGGKVLKGDVELAISEREGQGG